MGDGRTVLYKNDDGQGAALDMVPSRSIHLSGLVVYPFLPSGEVDIPSAALFEHGGHEEIGAEHVLVLYQPCTRVVGILQQQGAEHRPAVLGALFGLCVYIGHQFVLQLGATAEIVCELFPVVPRLSGRCSVHAAVAGEEAEGQPAAVEAFGALGHEAAYVIAPEAEPAQSDGETAADGSLETGFGGGGITAPVQRIAL